MRPSGILLVGFLLVALVVTITGAIIAAAPAIAVCLVIGLVITVAVCFGEDKPEDGNDKKPP